MADTLTITDNRTGKQYEVPIKAIVKAAFDRFDQVLGVLALRREEDRQTALPAAEIDRLVAARQDARKRRDFSEGDRIRQQLLDAGIVLEDSPSGTRWKRK